MLPVRWESLNGWPVKYGKNEEAVMAWDPTLEVPQKAEVNQHRRAALYSVLPTVAANFALTVMEGKFARDAPRSVPAGKVSSNPLLMLLLLQ